MDNQLTSVTIPGSVTSIGRDTFWGNSNLSALYFGGDAIEVFGSGYSDDPGVIAPQSCKVYRHPSAKGWPATGETWFGHKVADW